MKQLLYIFLILIVGNTQLRAQKPALVIIDMQEFYFEGGAMELEDPVAAATNAARLLDVFRDKGMLVVHVRHNYEPGGSIQELVSPEEGEPVITKDDVNAFKGTSLDSLLRANKITDLYLCGMQTHMCLEGATRAAADLGYKCKVIGDACATRELSYDGVAIPAQQVHLSTLATLTAYGEILTTDQAVALFR